MSSPMRASTSGRSAGAVSCSGRSVRAERLDARERHRGVAVRPRHLRVDLREHDRSRVHRRARRVDGRAERAEPVAVGRRELHEGGVERHRPVGEQARDVAQEDRHEVRATLVDGVAHARPGEQRHRAEAPLVLLLDEVVGPRRVQVVEPHVLEIVPLAHRLEQRARRRRGAVDEHPLVAADQRNDFFGGQGATLPGHGVASYTSAVPRGRCSLRRAIVTQRLRLRAKTYGSSRPSRRSFTRCASAAAAAIRCRCAGCRRRRSGTARGAPARGRTRRRGARTPRAPSPRACGGASRST